MSVNLSTTDDARPGLLLQHPGIQASSIGEQGRGAGCGQRDQCCANRSARLARPGWVGGSVSRAAVSDGDTVHCEQAELAVPDVVNVAEDLLQVVVHADVASGQFVVASGGKTADLFDGMTGFGSAAGGALTLRLRVHARMVGSVRGVRAEGGFGEPDGQQAGVDAEDADPVPAGFDREVLGQLDHRGLGHGAGGQGRPAVGPGLAGDVDDPAAPAGHPPGQGQPGADEGAEEVDIDRPAPRLEAGFPRRPGRSEDAGVVDQQFDRPSSAADAPDNPRRIRLVGDVCGQAQGAAA